MIFNQWDDRIQCLIIKITITNYDYPMSGVHQPISGFFPYYSSSTKCSLGPHPSKGSHPFKGTFCTTTLVRKKNVSLQVMTSLPVTWLTSFLVANLSQIMMAYRSSKQSSTDQLGNIVLMWLLLEAITCCSIDSKNRFWDENENLGK